MTITTRTTSTHWLAALGLAAAALASPLALADSLATSPYLLGDWDGSRTRLAERGVSVDLGYGSELAHNVSGGTAHLTRYTDQWNMGTTLDLDKLWQWRGAQLHFMITDRNGRDLGADAHIGNNQLIQEVYGRGQTWHLTTLSLEQRLFDGHLTLKMGRLSIGSDFASFSCDFQNLTFCGSPPGNIVGSYWANWPVSVWAGLARFKTTPDTYVQAGVYQVNPHYVSDDYATSRGLLPTFPHGTTGSLVPLEFGWLPKLLSYPGSYKAGLWYNSSSSADLVQDRDHGQRALSGAPARQRDGAYGGYLGLQQQVSGLPGGAGATLFFNATQADKFTAATDRQLALGMEYQGIFGRARDMLGVAVGASHANGRAADYQRRYNAVHPLARSIVNDGNEYVAEVFYSWSPIPSLSLRPNLQYIRHPGGSGARDSATVLGLKTSIAF